MRKAGWLGIAVAFAPLPAAAAPSAGSVLTAVPKDPDAVVVHAKGDGRTDDTAAIQAAIDQAHAKTGEGIVFLPSGRYRITHSILVPQGMRIYGVGATRPVLVLAPNTPGFQHGVSNMVIFTGGDQYQVGRIPMPLPTVVPRDKPVRDANSATFYSAMSNVDVEIGAGNPAAAAIRFHVAQHAFLKHMDFRLGAAFAGVYQAGNEMEDVHFHGGRYGIVTEKTSPAWQFTLIDSSFDGQRDAAIREHEAGLTLVNVTMRDTPVGIDIDKGYGDWLFGKNVRFENVSKAGVVISNEDNAYTQVGFQNALASDTPVFARFRDSGRTVTGKGRTYRVTDFGYGMTVPGLGEMGRYETVMKADAMPSMPSPQSPAIRALPAQADWINVKSVGVRGDGTTDDTAAIQRAIDTHRVLYFPTGFYRVTDTIRLKPDSVLIGLHPNRTQLFFPDRLPDFQGVGAPRPIIEAPKGGHNIVTGLGLFAGRINHRAMALMWKAGADSLVDDVKMMGGGGTALADGKAQDLYARAGGDPIANTWLDAQYPSIWVTDGGGGTFADVWSPDSFAQAGFYISNTSTPGHIYEVSVEHHVRNEFVLDHVQNWELIAPQTEQEVGEGMDAVSLELRNSSNILVANYHGYRVTRTWHPAQMAVKLYNSSDIHFRNVHVNGESGYATCDNNGCATYLRASKFPFENALLDKTHGLEVREREFARLDVPADPPQPVEPQRPAFLPANTTVRKLEGGFFSISGAAVDAAGRLYFVEHHFQRIYSWDPTVGLQVVRDTPTDPVNLAVAKSGDIMVLSSLGPQASVYSFDPTDRDGTLTMIEPTATRSLPGVTTLLPGNWWINGEFKDQLDPDADHFTTLAEMFARHAARPKAWEYVSPDGSLALPAFRVFEQGPPDHTGWRWSDSLDSYGFVGAVAGKRVFVSNGSEDKTYSALLGAGGSLTDLKPFANRGGESVAVG
ncbi:MAG: glycosyl hydrolase family 28-related protein, partial [Sphingomonas sp.]